MGHVRLAGRPTRTLVGLDGEVEGRPDGRQVGLRIVPGDGFEELLSEGDEIGILGLRGRGGAVRRGPVDFARLTRAGRGALVASDAGVVRGWAIFEG